MKNEMFFSTIIGLLLGLIYWFVLSMLMMYSVVDAIFTVCKCLWLGAIVEKLIVLLFVPGFLGLMLGYALNHLLRPMSLYVVIGYAVGYLVYWSPWTWVPESSFDWLVFSLNFGMLFLSVVLLAFIFRLPFMHKDKEKHI